MRTLCLLVAALAPLVASCGAIRGVQVPPAGPPPSVTWQLAAGTDFRSMRRLCDATNPDCRIPASTADRPTYAALTLWMSPGATPIQYTGAAIVGFIPSAQSVSGYELDLNYRVDPGGSPVAVSVNGIVTERPGQYTVAFRVLGQVEKSGDPKQLLVEIPVTIVPAAEVGHE